LHRLRPRSLDRDEPRFLNYALRAACTKDAFNDGHVSTIAHLTGDKLRAHRFCFPPAVEQRVIVQFLDEISGRTDGVERKTRREIALLREYRTRLIADVVTGKLDVREAAARLPDAAQETEAIEESETAFETDEAPGDDLDSDAAEIEE